MALSTVAGIFGSPTVQALLDKNTSFIAKNYVLHSSVKTNLARLKDSLVAVQSVVKAAEQQILDERLNHWLLNLKEITYEADDLIDTFEYLHLRKKVEGKSSVQAALVAVKRLLSPYNEIEELSFLVERLEMLASDVGDFIQLLRWEGRLKHADISEQQPRPSCFLPVEHSFVGCLKEKQRTPSCSLPFEHSFVGREMEKEAIINILLRTEPCGARNVPVLPILGVGGVGKTTLAQVVYNDEKVKKHFSLRMWVCVSESFDVTRITRDILEQADREANYSGITSFTTLQEDLELKLISEKFLLVLDDIWNETARRLWDILTTSLCYGKDGSMILLTSRFLDVAEFMGAVYPIILRGLPAYEYWSLFKEQSFRGTNPKEHPRLEAIGKKIASKLYGSPLAAKTLGALLNDKLDVDHWRSKMWELENGQDGIMSALRLCYLYLPAHLRQCFAYLSIFPKNWQFERDDVIRMWMAQGMIHHDNRTRRTEDVGKDYFNELISKSFFQPVNHDTDEYTIHYLLHDLAESVSKDDCFRIDGNEFRTIPTTIRHLYLDGKHLRRLKENTVVLKKLRTLILYGNSSANPNYADLQNLLLQLRNIRLFAWKNSHFEDCSDNLNRLIHLRYLDLRPCYIGKVPRKLYHLQTLALRYSRYHAGITNLINLRHLICDEDILSRVPGIGILTCLQKLSMFRVQRDPKFQVVQLKHLRELSGRLSIENLDCVESKEEAEEAKLCEKGYLEELCLLWRKKKSTKLDEVEVGILEGLRPNPNLKWLIIDGYRGTLSPSWMVRNDSLVNLVSLTISNCRAWKELPPLGQLLWLKELRIFGMDAVEEVGTGFHGKDGFPSLELLILEDFSQWEEWSADEKVILFPRLVRFQIRGCPRLQSIPPLPTTLEELTLEDIGLTILPNLQMASSRQFQGLSSLKSLGISMLPKIMTISFPEGLTQLKKLQISGCEQLSSIASFENLPSLQKLSITSCPKITIIIGLDQLTKLKRLEISNCKELSSNLGREALPMLNEYIVDGCPKISVVAGIFGSPTLQLLLDKTTSLLRENYKLQSSVKTNLERLKDSLVAVQSVVKKAEKQQIQDERLNVWLLNLKEITYETDDLIDTFEYRDLQKKVEGQSSVIYVHDTVKSVLSSDDENVELSNLVERLERLVSNVGNFIQLLRLEGQSQKHADISEQRKTSCFLPVEHSFVGRLKEKKAIINILLTTERRGARNVPVLPILGIGGVGKTTLAQVVYNDEEVEKHFSLRMWVCVSDSFDVTRITREILYQADRKANYSGTTSFKILQGDLKKKLKSEKFLLVLDDIWNETENVLWDTLKAPLCYGKDGSMILLTSRLPMVAKLMGTVDPIELEGLPEDEYWSFFKEQSFGGANPEEHPRLVAIGKKIASKLKGSPLAAKSMGALLSDNLDVNHWESISKSEIWELEKDRDGIMAALKPSYLHLPAHLRQCFAYLSIFPKDWQFERDDVIRMWMAQGMIHHDNRTKRTEDVGKDYFNELISKSFFQPVNPYTDKYTIPDLLHYLAESVSKDDCFRIDGDEFRTIPTTIRHLYLNEKHLGRLKENTVVLEKLSTLILCGKFSANPSYADLQDVIRQLRKIRLLALRRLHLQKCPDKLSSCIHLRYLDLSGNHEIKELPDELTMLHHLQTLNLFQLEFDRIPASMNKLISLRSLICSSRILSMVAVIGELTAFQQLSCPFYVQNVPGCLSIRYLENVQSEKQAREARLSENKNLVELDLHWGSAERNINPEVESGVLDGLEPSLNIKKLYINGYKGTLSPKWILPNFPNLVSVKLTSCSNWKELPALGECRRLEDLELSGMHAVHTFHSGGGGGSSDFQSLRKLTFDDLRELKMWSTDGKSILFPKLETLRISGCPKLTKIPQLPRTVERLELFIVRLSNFPELPTKSGTFSVLSIKGCPDLKSPGEWLLNQHENLEHLTELTVDPCDELDILLVKAINKLTGLKRLCIDSWLYYQEEEEEEEGEEEEEEEEGEEEEEEEGEEEGEEEEEDCGLLLESLISFEIINCVVAGKILSNSLQGLPALRVLRIDWCSGPTTLYFEEGRLTALNRLEVTNCRELTSLVGLGALFSLQDLKVIGCPELTRLQSSRSDEKDVVKEKKGGLTALSTLCIDNTLLLKVLLSGQDLASLKELEIICSDQEKIDEEVFHPLNSLQSLRLKFCPKLKTLSPLKNLHSLKKLEIEFCSNFQSLPSKEGLPPSLTHLVVAVCHPEFNKQYNRDDGPDWRSICDIRSISFD